MVSQRLSRGNDSSSSSKSRKWLLYYRRRQLRLAYLTWRFRICRANPFHHRRPPVFDAPINHPTAAATVKQICSSSLFVNLTSFTLSQVYGVFMPMADSIKWILPRWRVCARWQQNSRRYTIKGAEERKEKNTKLDVVCRRQQRADWIDSQAGIVISEVKRDE